MKRMAVLSIIGVLGVPIQAQAQSSDAATVAEFERRQQEVGRALSDIAEMRHRMMKELAKKLAEPEQNAPPTTQYSDPPAPPTAPFQVEAQTGCVRFPDPPNPDAELRYLLSHPGARVCPGPTSQAGQARVLDQISTDRVNNTARQICAMSGRC